MQVDSRRRTAAGGEARPAIPDRLPVWAIVGIAVTLAAAVVLRFASRSDLWLDEALTVNIARLPLRDLPDALRHDGAPPLYYALLHVWMLVFGDGDFAVRALSGVIGVATLPVAYFAGLPARRRRPAAPAVDRVEPRAPRRDVAVRGPVLDRSPDVLAHDRCSCSLGYLAVRARARPAVARAAGRASPPSRPRSSTPTTGRSSCSRSWWPSSSGARVGRPRRRAARGAAARGGARRRRDRASCPGSRSSAPSSQHTGTPWASADDLALDRGLDDEPVRGWPARRGPAAAASCSSVLALFGVCRARSGRRAGVDAGGPLGRARRSRDAGASGSRCRTSPARRTRCATRRSCSRSC